MPGTTPTGGAGGVAAGTGQPGRPYNLSQLESLWIDAGGPSASAPIAAAIAMAESGGLNQTQKGQPAGTTGWGLWQITPTSGSPGPYTRYLDPGTNAAQAVALFKARGNTFADWATFTSGKYKQFLSGAPAPQTVPQASTGLPGIPNPLSGLDAIVAFLTDTQTWVRIGEFILGALALYLGLHALTGQSSSPGQQAQHVKHVFVPIPA